MDTSANTITTMGIISNEVYADKGQKYFEDLANNSDGSRNYQILKANNHTYKVLDHTQNSTINGFEALLLQDTFTGKFVIAFRGTDSLLDDIIDVTTIPFGNANPQYGSAVDFVTNAITKYGIDKNDLTLTGHSLGGILTQSVGATLSIKGYAFNPWGSSALAKYPPNGTINLIARLLEDLGIYTPNAENFAKNNILNISFQDSGAINGDILSNFLTGIISEHLGQVIPVWGANIGLDGHRMPNLNKAIAHYNEVLSHFMPNTTYKELSKAYASSSLNADGFTKTEQIFNDLNIYNNNSNNLNFNFLTNKSLSQLNSKDPATLYALLHVNPFAIEGNLEAYNDINPDEYSDMQMDDLSQMLYSSMHKEHKSGYVYKNLITGESVVNAPSINQVMFGGDDDNLIRGESGDDTYYVSHQDIVSKSFKKVA